MSSKDMLLALINQKNPNTVPFDQSNVTLADPTTTVDPLRNTSVVMSVIPGHGAIGSVAVHYHRIDLGGLTGKVILVSDTPFTPDSVLAGINAVSTSILLGVDDIAPIIVPAMNPGDTAPLPLTADSKSFRWVGSASISLQRVGAAVYQDWIMPSHAKYNPSALDYSVSNQFVYNSQLWRVGIQGTIEILNTADGVYVQTIDLGVLLGSTIPPMISYDDHDPLWTIDTVRNHLWLRCSIGDTVGMPWLAVIDLNTKTLVISFNVPVGVSFRTGYLHYDPVSDLVWYNENAAMTGLDPVTGAVIRTITAVMPENRVVVDTDKGELWVFSFGTDFIARIHVYSTATGALVTQLTGANVPVGIQDGVGMKLNYFPVIKEIGLVFNAAAGSNFETFSTISYTRIGNTLSHFPGDPTSTFTLLGHPYYKADTDEFAFLFYSQYGSIAFTDRATKTQIRQIFSWDANDLYNTHGSTMCFGPDGALYTDVVYDYVFNSIGTKRYAMKLSPAALLADTTITHFPPPQPTVNPPIIPAPADWFMPAYGADNILVANGEIWSSVITRPRKGLVEITRAADGGLIELYGVGAQVGFVGATLQQMPNLGAVMEARQLGIDTTRNHFWTECATGDGHLIGVFDIATKTLLHSFITYDASGGPFNRDLYQDARYDAANDKVWFTYHDKVLNAWFLKSFNAATYTEVDSFQITGNGLAVLDTVKGEHWTVQNDGVVKVYSNSGSLLQTISVATSANKLMYLPGAGRVVVWGYDSDAYGGNGADALDFYSTTTYTRIGTWIAPSSNQFIVWNGVLDYLSSTDELLIGLENDDTDGSTNLIAIKTATQTYSRTLVAGSVHNEVPSSVVSSASDLYISSYLQNSGIPDNVLGGRFYLRKISAATLAAIPSLVYPFIDTFAGSGNMTTHVSDTGQHYTDYQANNNGGVAVDFQLAGGFGVTAAPNHKGGVKTTTAINLPTDTFSIEVRLLVGTLTGTDAPFFDILATAVPSGINIEPGSITASPTLFSLGNSNTINTPYSAGDHLFRLDVAGNVYTWYLNNVLVGSETAGSPTTISGNQAFNFSLDNSASGNDAGFKVKTIRISHG